MQIGSWQLSSRFLIIFGVIVLLAGAAIVLSLHSSASPPPHFSPNTKGQTTINLKGKGRLILNVKLCSQSSHNRCVSKLGRIVVRVIPIDSKRKALGPEQVLTTNSKGYLKTTLPPGLYALIHSKTAKVSLKSATAMIRENGLTVENIAFVS